MTERRARGFSNISSTGNVVREFKPKPSASASASSSSSSSINKKASEAAAVSSTFLIHFTSIKHKSHTPYHFTSHLFQYGLLDLYGDENGALIAHENIVAISLENIVAIFLEKEFLKYAIGETM